MRKPTLLFCMPAHGRHQLTRICLHQLRRTCDQLTAEGVEASAIVVADDENLDTARELGFGAVIRDNRFLTRRYNDALQLATDPAHNRRPADYVVPIGSDDWAHHSLFLELPAHNEMVGFQQMCFVREDGQEIAARQVMYPGGSGIRIYPRWVMEQVSYRPADEDRAKGCDTSILYNLRRAIPNLRLIHHLPEPWKLVDWKTPGGNVTPYAELAQHRVLWAGDPFEVLLGKYPDSAVAEMFELYERQRVLV